MQPTDSVIHKMQDYITTWKSCDDSRHIFLSCYEMMSANMLQAIERQAFHDNRWVRQLLELFADYYFESLDCYDCGKQTPKVWQEVHEKCKTNNFSDLQLLILGVNAHINYDLVLTLYDILNPEWEQLNDEQKSIRYKDHTHVNLIIGDTIDRVQDEILEPGHPSLQWIDTLMGRLDEFLISKLISSWREDVWENAQKLLSLKKEKDRETFILNLEKEVLLIDKRISTF